MAAGAADGWSYWLISQQSRKEGKMTTTTQLAFTHFPLYLISIPISYYEGKASLLGYLAGDFCHLGDNGYSPSVHSGSVYYTPTGQVHRPQKEPSLPNTVHLVQSFCITASHRVLFRFCLVFKMYNVC